METKEKSTAISMDNKENLRKVISILKYPVISDKSTRLLESNKYTFMVDRRANKAVRRRGGEALQRALGGSRKPAARRLLHSSIARASSVRAGAGLVPRGPTARH